MDTIRVRKFLAPYVNNWAKDVAKNHNLQGMSYTQIKQAINDYVVKNLSPRSGTQIYYDKSAGPDEHLDNQKNQKATQQLWESVVVDYIYDVYKGIKSKLPEAKNKSAKIISSRPGLTLTVGANIFNELNQRMRILDSLNLSLEWFDAKGHMEIPIPRVRVLYEENWFKDKVVVNIIEVFPSSMSRIVKQFGINQEALAKEVNSVLEEGDYTIKHLDSSKIEDLGIILQLYGKLLA